MLRSLFLFKDPKKVIDFIPDGDTIPVLYDLYDKYATGYFQGTKDDYSRAFAFSYPLETRNAIPNRFLPRFSLVAFLSQMPHMDFEKEITELKGEALTKEDTDEANERKDYATHWLQVYAPEDYRFQLQEDTIPESCAQFTDIQKTALRALATYIDSQAELSGQALHTALHSIKEETNISPKDFFTAIYKSVLGKSSGPKAGFLLSVLDKDWLVKRFNQVS